MNNYRIIDNNRTIFIYIYILTTQKFCLLETVL